MTDIQQAIANGHVNYVHYVRICLKNYLPGVMADNVDIKTNGTMFLDGKPFGTIKMFEGMDEPLFRFVNHGWMKQPIVRRAGRPAQAAFKLYLSEMGLPCLLFLSESINSDLLALIEDEMAGYPVAVDAKVVHTEEGWECWEPKKAMAWLHEVNSSYVVPDEPESEETRRYPAAWEGRELSWAHDEDTWVSTVAKSQEGRITGMVDIKDGYPVKFFFAEGGFHEFNLNLKQAYRGEKVAKNG